MNPADAIAAERERRVALKRRDQLARDLYRERTGVELPALVEFEDPATGDLLGIRVHAEVFVVKRANEIEERLHQEEPNG